MSNSEGFVIVGLDVVPFAGAWHTQFLGHAGVETEHKPSQHFAVHFVIKTVGALVEWIFADCKVLVWRSFDYVADWAV